KKDFVKAALADGFNWARRLDDKADIDTAVGEFIGAKGAAFLEVIIDPNASVYPMVAPGKSYKEMITGEWINAREQSEEEPAGAVSTPHMF
ncbi:MAG: acetolactate synthase, large subunit, biosynthetic type, partial [Sinobacteraceae bacterium]|nr:acetolactate synthase, large subunit, biosynthetic type [Nevskiaceae bacterium]